MLGLPHHDQSPWEMLLGIPSVLAFGIQPQLSETGKARL